jgi:hypothetical protein
MPVAISDISFINLSYYNMLNLSDIASGSDEGDRLSSIINSNILIMEKFCNRPLKARNFYYEAPVEELEGEIYNYDEKYSTFNPPEGTSFWFPTYPVNSITEFLITGTAISPSTDYTGDDGYILYKSKGNLYYSGGFDYGYFNNVKIKWNGGYSSSHIEDYNQLQYIQFLFTKFLYDNDPINDSIIKETLSNYSYTRANPKDLADFMGIPILVFNLLNSYRRMYFP